MSPNDPEENPEAFIGKWGWKHHREASIPEFGARDKTDPKPGEGFIVIFNRVKENQIASTTFPSVLTQPEEMSDRMATSASYNLAQEQKIISFHGMQISMLYQSSDIYLLKYANPILVQHAVVRLMSPSDLAILNLSKYFVMAAKVKKQSLGRQKIEIKKIENKSSLEVTFTKRRHGLFNKASELCVLTGAEAAVIAFSPGKKAFAFAVQESRREYVEALAKKEEQEKKRVEMLKEGGKVGFGLDRFWWDLSIEGMGLEELEQYVASMEELKRNVGIRVDELEKASNSPSRFLDLDSGVIAIENFSTN
ncbi:hypothetical protein SADUNF_Sadunf04G0001400 [Salix dunnii]|uniref:MADS-box domain-containing protein n=1 Tax=Salix dunnii TaxID=1413687 RepID=A0A835K9Q3_9ROSI|nr:hypothetical protein SADUNF_Sadunf04G0001400 [Salix dunnii]